MSKRFTDTQIWEKEWFMSLSTKHKCLWRYLTERCDQAGVWEPNWQLATIYIGDSVTNEDLFVFGEHIEVLENGKVFIPDFINFQYGRLSENSPAHKPIFRAIEKNNLTCRVFDRVSNTLQEKEKEKVLEVEPEVEKEKEIGPEIFFPFDTWQFREKWNQWLAYRKQIKDPLKPISQQAALKRLSNHPEAEAMAMIDQSIANGWKGLFEIKAETNGKPHIQTTLDRLNSY